MARLPRLRLLALAAASLSLLAQCSLTVVPPRAHLMAAGTTEVAGARQAAPLELSPLATRQLLQTGTQPARNEADLARRFKLPCGAAASGKVPLYFDEPVGSSRTFEVLDEPNRRFFEVPTTLRYASTHLLFYVQDGVQLNQDAMVSSANVFEQKTWPLLRQYFGDLPEEPRLTIFNGRVPGVGGYFSASDLYPRDVNPHSNERAMVFMSLDAARPGTGVYESVMAHEVQHFVHWVIHPQQDSWINEGASELAMAIAGYDQSSAARAYLNRPETQLDAWAEQTSETFPYYGGGYLFLEYFAQRMGGYDKIKGLIASPGVSTHTVDAYLARAGLRFDDLFRDFVIANLVNDRSLADGRYGHDKLSARARVQETISSFPAVSANAVRPYATRYVELTPSRTGDLEIRFSGVAEARLFGGAPHSGKAQWWGNAADEMESTMTREVDLTRVQSATLSFAAWFDTERDYDYAGVAVSTDGGCTWKTLPGRYTTDTDPVGQNLGYAFTGHSGGGDVPVWVDEQMDLTPFAGQRVLLRFYNVTDQSYHGSGVAIDDIAIPEIGFFDDAETEQDWVTSGFMRSVNAATAEWAAQVVSFGDGSTQVQQIPVSLTPDGSLLNGSLTVRGFGSAVKRVVVAISPMVPVTLEPADYRLEAVLR